MLYLTLNSKLTITNAENNTSIVFDHISEAEIKESVKVLGDTATVVIPRRYGKLKEKEILKYFKIGDKMLLELGYNGELHPEFKGYIREIESGFPLKLQCDDELYLLRKNNFNKAWAKISLKELLSIVAVGYKIECPDVNLGAFQIDNASTITVLRNLQQQYGFYSFIRDKTLYCQFAFDVRGLGKTYTYNFAENVKKSNLIFKRKEDFTIRIRAVSNLLNGKKISVEVGSKEPNATIRSLNFSNKTEKELRELATKELERLVFDGFTGSVTGFGYPRITAGDTLELISPREPEKDGKYLVESLTKRYGNAYYERVCELSYRV